MTPGHKHRTISLKHGGLTMRLLTKHLVETMDYDRVEHSRWVWGLTIQEGYTVYVLSPLGILHALFGLTIKVKS